MPITVAAMTSANPAASVLEYDLSPSSAPPSWRPTKTNSAPLIKNVVNVQNATACTRVCAPMTRGPTWAIASPQTTTAKTPEAWISSAPR